MEEGGRRPESGLHRIFLHLGHSPGVLAAFFPFFQRGVTVPAETGTTLEDFLCLQLGISPDFVTTRITTIFLDGRAVDDLQTARLRNGATLALSAAMPGLVGATVRRAGPYAAMRGAITHRESKAQGVGAGTVKVKLFNLLMGELGGILLKKGILLDGSEAAELLGRTEIRNSCRKVMINGYPPNGRDPDWDLSSQKTVHLTVDFGE